MMKMLNGKYDLVNIIEYVYITFVLSKTIDKVMLVIYQKLKAAAVLEVPRGMTASLTSCLKVFKPRTLLKIVWKYFNVEHIL